MSALQRPIPFMPHRAACASSAGLSASPARSNPLSQAAATARRVLIFGLERPAAARSPSENAASVSGVRGDNRVRHPLKDRSRAGNGDLLCGNDLREPGKIGRTAAQRQGARGPGDFCQFRICIDQGRQSRLNVRVGLNRCHIAGLCLARRFGDGSYTSGHDSCPRPRQPGSAAFMSKPVFRFAPSPNGHLHIGHALSALLNARASVALEGRFLVRVEDIDQARCTPELEADMFEDLAWLGLPLDEPVLRQSEHFPDYRAALERLQDMGLIYPAYLSRAEIRRFVQAVEESGKSWPRDPDGAPLYPGDRSVLSETELGNRMDSDAPFTLRLDMHKALARIGSGLTWQEAGSEGRALFEPPGAIAADAASWGDVVVARKDTPTSYHLAVVIDDARQGITDVLRGQDLYQATSVHRVLQELLELPQPRFRHHRLILGRMAASSRNRTMTRASGHCAKAGCRSRNCGGASAFDPGRQSAPPNQ